MPARQPLPDHLHSTLFGPGSVGLGRGRLAGPDLLRPHHGARVSRGGPLDPATLEPTEALRLRCRLALHVLGTGAFVDGITAARIWPLPLPDQPRPDEALHLSVWIPERATRRPGIFGRQISEEHARTVIRHGLLTIDAAALFCHLGLFLSVPDLTAVGDALVLDPRVPEPGRPYISLPALTERVGWYRGRGKRAAAMALELIRPGAESRPETLLRLHLVAAGLPEPTVNRDITTDDGRFIARGDLVYQPWRVIVEYDGDHHRVDRSQWESDIVRQERLVAAGWTVIRVTAQSFFGDPTGVTVRVRQALLASGWAP